MGLKTARRRSGFEQVSLASSSCVTSGYALVSLTAHPRSVGTPRERRQALLGSLSTLRFSSSSRGSISVSPEGCQYQALVGVGNVQARSRGQPVLLSQGARNHDLSLGRNGGRRHHCILPFVVRRGLARARHRGSESARRVTQRLPDPLEVPRSSRHYLFGDTTMRAGSFTPPP